MKRAILPLLTLTLLLLLVGERLSRSFASTDRVGPGVEQLRESHSEVTVLPSSRVAPPPTMPARGGTPTVDRLARLAARRLLDGEGRQTYLDSLMLTTDSVVRRWPDRAGTPLRVAIVEGGPPDYASRMATFVREALARWEETGAGLRFDIVSDTAGADIAVRWIDRFGFERAGQTDLTWDQFGRVRKATIMLAVHTDTGAELPDISLLSVALHEAGHAIGLPHSADSSDVMFPATRTGSLSDRDRRTALLLYRLPPGSVRDAIVIGP